jgi:biotin carboxyl carrier protein
MRVEVEVGGRVRVVEVEHRGASLVVRLDGRERVLDAVEVAGRWSVRFPETGEQHAAVVTASAEPGQIDVLVNGLSVPVRMRAGAGPALKASGTSARGGRVTAPMPGKVVKILVAVGHPVTARQSVAVIEAMKMENELRAGRDGVVRAVLVAEGASVDAGTAIVVIE